MFARKVTLTATAFVIYGSLISAFSPVCGSPHRGGFSTRDLRMDENQGLSKEDAAQKLNRVFPVWRIRVQDGLADLNCTVPAIVHFPATFFSEEQREKGAVALNFLFAIYLFGALAYVCSVYFVPSLEIISKTLGIQEDVAGATFMAIGSSAPELFSSAIGTFVTFDNTGLSAIIGSAAFNVFVIIALCAFFAGGKEGLKLLWYPVIRDLVCWFISVVILIAVTADGLVQWWEGLIMTLGFLGYILIMAYNKPVSKFFLAWSARTSFLSCQTSLSLDRNSKRGREERNAEEMSLIDGGVSGDEGLDEPPPSSRTFSKKEYLEDSEMPTANDISPSEYTDSIPSVFDPPESTALYVVWLLGLPTILLLHYTVPDYRMPGLRRRCYLLTFVMSTVWLALLSYLLYWMVEVIGYTLGVSDTIMGYTVLAIGTSVPDAIASVLVAIDGFPDMAVANIIGSNLFETFICLGTIWFLKSLTAGPAGSPVAITEDGLTVTSMCLVFSVSFLIVAIHNNSWRLNFKVGVTALLLYLVFIAWAILNAEGVFGAVFQGNVVQLKPSCPPSLFGL